jgi:hypothetical protein
VLLLFFFFFFRVSFRRTESFCMRLHLNSHTVLVEAQSNFHSPTRHIVPMLLATMQATPTKQQRQTYKFSQEEIERKKTTKFDLSKIGH